MLLRPRISARVASTLSFCSRPPAVMPLRSKITSPAFSSQKKMSTAPAVAGTNPADDVLFNSSYGVRTIELNRPEKYNSLNESMALKILPRLQEWEKSQLANIIILKGAGEKALCAGGDVVVLAQNNTEGPEGIKRSVDYFGLEYRLDHLIATYPKPYVAFMDGYTMGGGVGLSVHAPFRIATERTDFAMPETTIGFFPDVGGSFFLPRLDGQIGTYLALTSKRLQGVHAMYAGIATHYIHSSSLPDLEARLAELSFSDSATLQERYDIVDSTIEEFVTGLPKNEPFELSGGIREAIDRCFSFDTIPEIFAALKSTASTPSETSDWAKETQKIINDRSPTSVHVALKQMRLGENWAIAEAFQREYHIAARFMEHPDFVEGVQSLLVRKSRPSWQPNTIEEVDPDTIESFFALREGEQRLQLLRNDVDGNYKTYPHEHIGLPAEKHIESVVRAGKLFPEDVVKYFVEARSGKAGVKEKVEEVVRRMTTTDNENGFAVWKETSTWTGGW